jgi:hypothetical protein
MTDIQASSAVESTNGDLDLKFTEAKAYLLTASPKSGDNV